MNVLLLEPEYKHKPLVGPMKFYTYFSKGGNDVRYSQGNVWLDDFEPDTIVLTSGIFSTVPLTIDLIQACQKRYPRAYLNVGGVMATLHADTMREATGATILRRDSPLVDMCRPHYDMHPDLDHSIVFTSKGCPRHCPFCLVPEVEDRYLIWNWMEHLKEGSKRIFIQDSNWIATPRKHKEDVVEVVKNRDLIVDFNSGFSTMELSEKDFVLLSRIKKNLACVRIALDRSDEMDKYTRCIEWAKQYLTTDHRKIRSYVLFNYDENPGEAWERAHYAMELGASPFAMAYVPLDWFSTERYVSDQWTYEEVMMFARYWNRPWIWRKKRFKTYEELKKKWKRV